MRDQTAKIKMVEFQLTKLGDIASVSIPYGRFLGDDGEIVITCPGASPWCLSECYNQYSWEAYPTVRKAYIRNYYASLNPEYVDDAKRDIRRIERKNRKAYGESWKQAVRIHVSGDFYSLIYILKWVKIVRDMPDIKFYAYTRSWQNPELLPHLETLRSLPNMQLFASTDESIDAMPPEGWRVAYIMGDARFDNSGMPCIEQTAKKANCQECGYCFLKTRGNVGFTDHDDLNANPELKARKAQVKAEFKARRDTLKPTRAQQAAARELALLAD